MKYTELKVWQKGMALVESIYYLSKKFPPEERYCLTSQIRRSAISIVSNIAEGYGRYSRKNYFNYLTIAYGSLLELETQLKIANRLDYLEDNLLNECERKTEELEKMLNVLMNKIKGKTEN